MQFIFKETVIHYEWMPDGPVKKLFDRYAEKWGYSEGQRFSLDGVLEHFNDVRDQDAISALETFIEENNLCLSAVVDWSW